MKIHYTGTTIIEISKISKANGEVKYEAGIKSKDVIFDSNGKFVKEIKIKQLCSRWRPNPACHGTEPWHACQQHYVSNITSATSRHGEEQNVFHTFGGSLRRSHLNYE